MSLLYLLVFGSLIAGVVLAVAWWLIRGHRTTLPADAIGGYTLTAGILLLLAEMASRFVGASILLPFTLPSVASNLYMNFRFAVPLLVGILGVAVLSMPVQARAGRGAAELTRRSLVSFTRANWFVAPGVLLGVILLITVAAGTASRPDGEGRHTLYVVDLGAGRSMGTSIYGWFNSVPSMILMGILVVIVSIGLTLIARPPLAENREEDVRVRTMRTRNILAAGTGALLLHLGVVVDSLAGTASVRSTFTFAEGPVSFWTSFSAFQPAFQAIAMVCAALGVALWASIALSAIPTWRRARVGVDA